MIRRTQSLPVRPSQVTFCLLSTASRAGQSLRPIRRLERHTSQTWRGILGRASKLPRRKQEVNHTLNRINRGCRSTCSRLNGFIG